MPPGKYYIYAQKMDHNRMESAQPATGKPDIRPVLTYYPASTSMSGASLIDVAPGQQLTGMDIHLKTSVTYHVRGKVAGALPKGNITVSLVENTGSPSFFFGAGMSGVNQKDNSFDVAGIAPGSYKLNVWHLEGGIKPMGMTTVDVSSTDVNDVVVGVFPEIKIQGTIRMDGSDKTNLSDVRVNLQPTDFTFMHGPLNSKQQPDGHFTIDSLVPSKYMVHVNGLPKGAYVKSVLFNSQDEPTKQIDLSGGAGGTLEVVLRPGAPEVDGVIQAEHPSGAAILIADGSTGDRPPLVAEADANGAFKFTQLAPGKYQAYALEQMEYGLWQNPDFLKQMASKALEVEVKENDTKQVQLKLTTDDEVHQVQARVGLESPQ